MKSPRVYLSVAALTVCLFGMFGPLANAHDIVLVPDADRITVRYGHPGDWLPIDQEKLLDVNIHSAAGAPADLSAQLKRQGLTLTLRQNQRVPALLSARYDNGLWLKLPVAAGAKEHWRNASRFMLGAGTEPLASVKFAKALLWSATDTGVYKLPVGHLLELVPQRNPATIRIGETLPVLVQFNGRPLPGAGVEVSDLVKVMPEDEIARYKTDANGIAQVPIPSRGLTVLAVDVQQPNDGSLGDAAKALPVDTFLLVATYAFRR